MPDTALNGELLRRWNSLANVDRTEILDALPADRREQLESLLTEIARRSRPDRQFTHYSTWLGELIEASMARETGPECKLPAAVREALREAHMQLCDGDMAVERGPGLMAQFRLSLRRMADAL